jgi:hypothetical protein
MYSSIISDLVLHSFYQGCFKISGNSFFGGRGAGNGFFGIISSRVAAWYTEAAITAAACIKSPGIR